MLLLTVVAACSSGPPEKTLKNKKADLYYSHGTSNLLNKDYTSALDHLLKADALRPNDTKIHNNLGMAYYFKGRIKKAKYHLTKSIKLNEKNSDAKNNLASVYFNSGQYDLAEKEYLKVQNDLVYKHQYRTFYNLALISLKKNRFAEAVERYKKSIKENENFCPSYFQLGELAKKQNRPKLAYDYYLQASRGTCYNNPAPHYFQALMLIKLKRTQDARIKLQEIIERFNTSKYASMASKTLMNKVFFKQKTSPSVSANQNRKATAHKKGKVNTYKAPTF